MSLRGIAQGPWDEAQRRSIAGFLVHASLAGRRMPPHVPGDPNGMAALDVARREAPLFLENLAGLYGIERWDLAAFERAFLRGALEGWRPGSVVKELPGGIRLVSTSCPLALEAEADPRVCQACRAFQEQVARLALPGQVARVSHEELMTRGDSACVLKIELRDEEARAQAP